MSMTKKAELQSSPGKIAVVICQLQTRVRPLYVPMTVSLHTCLTCLHIVTGPTWHMTNLATFFHYRLTKQIALHTANPIGI